MGFRLAQPAALLLLLLLPGVAALFLYGDRRRRAAITRFAQGVSAKGSPVTHFDRVAHPMKQTPVPEAHCRPAKGPVDDRKRRYKRIAVLAALAIVIVALARPVWIGGAAPPPPNTSDVVFLLDVSRSMLADDAKPTRLDHAKSIVADLVKQFKTERTALVTFAGNCAVQCPLTIDYNYFRDRLDATDFDSVTRGGTRIGEAIAFSLNTAFDDVQRGRKQLVLLTDGGDQDSQSGAAAQLATARKVRIVSIGIGNSQVGTNVPISATDRSPFLYEGHPVSTRLENTELESLANLNLGGVYLHAGTGAIDSAQVYRQLLAASSPVAGGPPRNETDGYPFLLALAIALLIAESLLSDRRLATAALVLFVASRGGSQETPNLPEHTSAEPVPVEATNRRDDSSSVAGWVKSGNQAFAEGRYSEAWHFYVWASETAPNSPEVLFDLALGLYKTDSYQEAASTFERAAAHSHDNKFRAQCKFGQANAAYRLAVQQHSRHLFDFQQALSLTLPIYREALALDPGLTDCKYNIEVIKRKLRELTGPMRAATSRYMAQSREDLARRKNVEASQILQENKNTRKTTGQVGRLTVATDW